MRQVRCFWVLLSASLLLPGVAFADAVSVGLSGRAQLGKAFPYVEIQINEPIAGFQLLLTRSDGARIDEKGGGRPGQTRRVELRQPEGKFSYQGELRVNFKNADTASLPLQFEAELWGPLKLTLAKSEVDLPRRKVVVRLNRPAAKAQVRVLMDTGEYAFDGEVPFHGEPAGTPLEIRWPRAEGKVMKISIRAFDEATFYDGVEIFPWQVDIPHEEVNFDSGKWNVRKDQEQKLESSFKLISEAVAKYGRLAKLRLYVAGHTDSVGSPESNRALSLQRARSLGTWFQHRGLRIPVYCEGFGEQALRVGTADETDEPQNRRAEYIISVDEPTLARTPFTPAWRKL